MRNAGKMKLVSKNEAPQKVNLPQSLGKFWETKNVLAEDFLRQVICEAAGIVGLVLAPGWKTRQCRLL
jgi:hypothetical protein